MALTSPRFDLARFGAEAPRFSPGKPTCSGWSAPSASVRRPVLKRIYEQMMAPKYVLAFGTCASQRRLLRQLHDRPGNRQNHPGRRLRPGLSAASRSRPRRAHAPSRQDRARRAAPRASSSRERGPAEVARLWSAARPRAAGRGKPEVSQDRSSTSSRRGSARRSSRRTTRVRRRHGPREPSEWRACASFCARTRARLRHARQPLRRRLPDPRAADRGRAAPLLDRGRHRIRLKARVGDDGDERARSSIA